MSVIGYGTTAGGGAGAGGTVFKMTPAGALLTLVSFNRTNGISPQAPLVRGRKQVAQLGNAYSLKDSAAAKNGVQK